MMRRWGGRAALLAWVLAPGLALAQVNVTVASLDRKDGKPIGLAGHWFAASGEGALPAVLLLHGCGGAYDSQGRVTVRMREYAALLNAQGWHALVLDSLKARGERELCTQDLRARRVTQVQRRRDALGGLHWLAASAGVDADRLALVGWSNGGSTVLAATNLGQADVAASAIKPRAAVAFYPGCASELARGYRPSAPLLVMVGALDDWTPPSPCLDLAAASPGEVHARVYEGAYHGFDGNAPVRLRRDVPGGVKPGQGVTVGGQPVAREASRVELLAHLRQQLAP